LVGYAINQSICNILYRPSARCECDIPADEKDCGDDGCIEFVHIILFLLLLLLFDGAKVRLFPAEYKK
jgi:hypothetical protein